MSPRSPAQIIPPMSRVDRVTARSIRESERRKRDGERRRAYKADSEAWQDLAARLTEAHQVTFTRIDWAEIEASPATPYRPSRAGNCRRIAPRSPTTCWVASATGGAS